MRNIFGSTLLLHCAPHQLTLQRRSRFGHDIGVPIIRSLNDETLKVSQVRQQLPHHLPHQLPHQQAHQLIHQLHSALTEFDRKGAMVNVEFADGWCRLFVTTPPSNMTNRSDCDAAVAMRFHTLYGDSVTDWDLRSDWQVGKPFITAAIPRALYRDVLATCRAFRLHVVGLVPESIAKFNRWSSVVRAGDWFAQISEFRLTLYAFDGVQIRHIVQQALDTAACLDNDWLSHFVQREALRLDMSIPKRIVCAGEVSSAWRTVDLDINGDYDTNNNNNSNNNSNNNNNNNDINTGNEILSVDNRPLCCVVAEKSLHPSKTEEFVAPVKANNRCTAPVSTERSR